MIYFIYGPDSFRSKQKLQEIIDGYKKVHKSGLNLLYIDAKEKSFKDFYSNFKITSMFAEKKLIVLKDVFADEKFREGFSADIKNIEELKDIVIVYENEDPDQRIKLFKELQKHAKCQEFDFLQPAVLAKWIFTEFEKNHIKINSDAVALLLNFSGNDLWQISNEIKKLSNYKKDGVIKKEDIELMVRPNTEIEEKLIFKTTEALASKNKKLALDLLHKHLDAGDPPIKLLSNIAYQFRILLIIKELQVSYPYSEVVKRSGLNPFVVQKTFYLCNQFSMSELKKIYQKIFKTDSDIKTGKIDPELALDLFVSAI